MQLSLWDKDFFVVVDLAGEEVGPEAVVDVVFFLGHAPPSEVHLFPGGAVCDYLIKFVVALRALERFAQVVTVLEVTNRSENCASSPAPKVKLRPFCGAHSLDQISS